MSTCEWWYWWPLCPLHSVCLQKMEYFWKRITADPQRAKEYGNPVSVITSSVHTTFDNFGFNDGALG